jgi:hypothetical protein
VKQSIKRSLLSLMLLGAAANIQASAEEKDGGGAAAVADISTNSTELQPSADDFFKNTLKPIIKELLVNWPNTVDEAVRICGDDGSLKIREAMGMMFESFPRNIELSAETLEVLLDGCTKSLEACGYIPMFSDLQETLKISTADLALDKIIRETLKQILAEVEATSIYPPVPTDEKLADIITQSEILEDIKFVRGPLEATFSKSIIIPENYRAAAILHEIGHIVNQTYDNKRNLQITLVIETTKHLLVPHLSIKDRLKFFLTAHIAMLSFLKKEERDADMFMLEKATQEQLVKLIAFFSKINRITTPSDWLFDEKEIQQMLVGEKAFKVLGEENALPFIQFFYMPHPSFKSRIERMNQRVAELSIANLQTEAEALSAAELEERDAVEAPLRARL